MNENKKGEFIYRVRGFVDTDLTERSPMARSEVEPIGSYRLASVFRLLSIRFMWPSKITAFVDWLDENETLYHYTITVHEDIIASDRYRGYNERRRHSVVYLVLYDADVSVEARLRFDLAPIASPSKSLLLRF